MTSRRPRVLLLGVLLFVIVGAYWATISPVGSSPDDDYHLSSIWCVRDAGPSGCVVEGDTATVPAALVDAGACYRDSRESAACSEDRPAGVVTTPHVNQIEHLYPQGFYTVMSVFIGEDIGRSVLVMRLFNVLLAALVFALVLLSAGRGMSRSAALTVALTMMPLGWFIVASVNPSGWTVVGVGLSWMAAYAFAVGPGSRGQTVAALAAMVLGALMAIGSRVDGSVYLVFSYLIVLILWWFRAPGRRPVRLIPMGALSVLAGIAYVMQSRYLLIDGVEPETTQNLSLLFHNASNVLALHQGALGGWPLGWLDTGVPTNVSVLGLLCVGLVLGYAVTVGERGKWIAAALAVGAALLVPVYLLQQMGVLVGDDVQPRYLLPLILVSMGVLCLTDDDDRPLALPESVTAVVQLLLVVAGLLSMWAVAHRYAVGEESGPIYIGPDTWPGLVGMGLVLPWAVAALAYVGWVFWALRWEDPQAMRHNVTVPEPLASA